MAFVGMIIIAREQALHVGLTRDLFWARAASGRERIGAGTYVPAPILSRPLLSPAPILAPPLAARAQNKSRVRPK